MKLMKLDIQKFALSGSFRTNISSSRSYYIEWSATQNINSNYSTVTAKVYVYNSSVGVYCNGNCTLNIDGTDYNFENNNFINENTTTLIHTQTKTIVHNSNGTRNFSISFYGDDASLPNPDYDTYSGNGSWSLNVINRYASITEYSIINYGIETVRVTWGADVACDAVQYSFNGTNWYTSPDASIYPSFNIYGLTPNVNYNIKIRVKRTDSQLWTESSFFNITTSQISLVVSADNFNDTQNPKLYFTNASGAQLNVRLEATGLSIRRDGIPNSTSPYTFVLTEAERNQLRAYTPNSNTASIRFTIATLVNGTEKYHSFQDKTLTIINANPVFTNFTYADTNSTTIALTGSNQKIVKGYSNVVATVSVANKAVAQKYATMSKYRLVIGNKQVDANYSSNADVNLQLNNIDNNVFTLYAIDSRGNSTSKQISPSTYINYFKPTVLETTAVRTNSIGTETTLSFNGSFFNASFGNTQNDITLAYQYKKTSDSTYVDGVTPLTLAKDGNNFSFNNIIAGDLGANGFDVNYSYNIRLVATDSLDTTSYDFILGTGKPNLAISKNGVAINNVYDETIGGDLQVPTSIKIGTSTALKVSDINNTVTSTSTVQPLSANMGKSIYDKMVGTVLYNDTTGTVGTVTLSSSAANFDYIEIYYHKSGGYNSTSVYSPNGKEVSLCVHNAYGATDMQQYNKSMKISGTSMTVAYSNYQNFSSSGVGPTVNENEIYVVRVVGYKY